MDEAYQNLMKFANPANPADVFGELINKVQGFAPQINQQREMEAQAYATPAQLLTEFNQQNGAVGGVGATNRLSSILKTVSQQMGSANALGDIINASRGNLSNMVGDVVGAYKTKQDAANNAYNISRVGSGGYGGYGFGDFGMGSGSTPEDSLMFETGDAPASPTAQAQQIKGSNQFADRKQVILTYQKMLQRYNKTKNPADLKAAQDFAQSAERAMPTNMDRAFVSDAGSLIKNLGNENIFGGLGGVLQNLFK